MRKWMNLFESIAEDIIAEPRSQNLNPVDELAHVRAQLADFKSRHDDLVHSFREPGFDQRKQAFISDVGDRWSHLADREWQLMKQVGETGSRKSLREFFS